MSRIYLGICNLYLMNKSHKKNLEIILTCVSDGCEVVSAVRGTADTASSGMFDRAPLNRFTVKGNKELFQYHNRPILQ